MLGTYGRRWLRRAGFKHRECQRQGLAAMRAVRAVLSQPGARGGPVTRVLLPPLLAPAPHCRAHAGAGGVGSTSSAKSSPCLAMKPALVSSPRTWMT